MSKLLVVVDMQNDFVNGSLGTNEAKTIIPNVKKKIKEYKSIVDEDVEIVFTRDTHKEDYMNTEEGKNLPVEHCIKDTNGWEIVDELKELVDENDTIIDKATFGSLVLSEQIMLQNVAHDPFDTIELVGLCTDVCVISNAIACKMGSPNSHIVVDASCCAGVTPHSHDVAIEAMKGVQVEILNEGAEPWRE